MRKDIIEFASRSIPHDASVPITCLIILIAVFIFARRKSNDITTAVFSSLLVSYMSFVLWSTLVRRSVVETGSKLIPYWNYRDLMIVKDPFDYFEIFFNIALFIPVGISLRGVIGAGKAGRIILYGFLCSMIIELAQFVFNRGLCETNDVIHNTIGCAFGVGLFYLVKTVIYKFKK